MQNVILSIHVIFGILFVFAVLIQDKGTGLSATFGGSGGFYASERGAAKVMHYLTMVFALVFFASALVFVVLPKPEPGLKITPITDEESVDLEKAPIEVEAQ